MQNIDHAGGFPAGASHVNARRFGAALCITGRARGLVRAVTTPASASGQNAAMQSVLSAGVILIPTQFLSSEMIFMLVARSRIGFK
jgi:hypothetical protein